MAEGSPTGVARALHCTGTAWQRRAYFLDLPHAEAHLYLRTSRYARLVGVDSPAPQTGGLSDRQHTDTVALVEYAE